MNKTHIFKELPPTLILQAHYEPEELAQLRKTLENNGCQVTTSIYHAEIVITKLTQEKRIRREIHELIRSNNTDDTSSTKDIDVVKEKWVRKSIEKGKLVDYPFTDTTWRIVRIPSIQPITPPKRTRSPEKFALPGEPASKRRTLSRSESFQTRPFATSAPSFESASSDDPTSKHFHPASQSSATSGEEDNTFDFRDVYACRRKSPLISRNEKFIQLLVEIKLARELALCNPLVSI
jgi:hypothetical protein